MYALRSGIHAESTIITGEDGTRPTHRNFLPRPPAGTAMERALLDNVIRDTWLLTRFFLIRFSGSLDYRDRNRVAGEAVHHHQRKIVAHW
jgi:hypothetical protein